MAGINPLRKNNFNKIDMSKDSINVKSNGLRNELKEIRKSIDKLTNAILVAQTNKRYEESYNYDITHSSDGMQWLQNNTAREQKAGVSNDD